MKTKLFISVFFVIASLFYIFSGFSSKNTVTETWSTVSAPPQPNNGDEFLIGFMQSAGQLNHSYYDSLETNITQSYIGTVWDTTLQRHAPIGWLVANDSLLSPVKTDALRTVMNNAYTHKQNRYIWMRPKISWLAYGQSSTYEAELVTGGDRWFYSFQNRSGQSVEDSGHTVLYCGMPAMGVNAGIVLQRLKANTEQSRRVVGDNEANHWEGDSECKWYIMPRIRIDSMFAHNNPTTPVCSIKVIAQDGQTVLKNSIIKARNFLDQFDNYDGRYKEEFRIFPGDDSLRIHGDWGDKWNYAARGDLTAAQEQSNNKVNHADIQVYWYDNCEMWLDYVKVENDVARDLLSDNPQNENWVRYNQWLADEVNAVNVSPYIYNYYIELFEYNNIPCMAYVNHKLNSLSGGTVGLMADQLTQYQCHLAESERGTIVSAEQIKNNYVNVVGSKEVFIGDPYPITAAYPNGCYGGTTSQLKWCREYSRRVR